MRTTIELTHGELSLIIQVLDEAVEQREPDSLPAAVLATIAYRLCQQYRELTDEEKQQDVMETTRRFKTIMSTIRGEIWH